MWQEPYKIIANKGELHERTWTRDTHSSIVGLLDVVRCDLDQEAKAYVLAIDNSWAELSL